MKKIVIILFALVSIGAVAQETETRVEQVDSNTFVTYEYKVNRRGYVKEMKVVELKRIDSGELETIPVEETACNCEPTAEQKHQKVIQDRQNRGQDYSQFRNDTKRRGSRLGDALMDTGETILLVTGVNAMQNLFK